MDQNGAPPGVTNGLRGARPTAVSAVFDQSASPVPALMPFCRLYGARQRRFGHPPGL
jgi:hypothetical protein